MAALAGAAPAADADAEADAQFLGYAGHAVAAPLAHAVAPVAVAAPAPNCVTEDVILVTQVCTPAAEEVCSTETVATQEIEYEKVCTEIVDTLCDAPVAAVAPFTAPPWRSSTTQNQGSSVTFRFSLLRGE